MWDSSTENQIDAMYENAKWLILCCLSSFCPNLFPLSGSWLFSVSELAVPGAEVGRISATDADLGDNAKLEYTILDGESGDTFNITGANQEAVIILNKVGRMSTVTYGKGRKPCWKDRLRPAWISSLLVCSFRQYPRIHIENMWTETRLLAVS